MMIKCSTCGATIAQQAPTCPSCGAPNPKARRGIGGFLWLGILVMPLLFAWFTLRPGVSNLTRLFAFAWLAFVGVAATSSGKGPLAPLVSPETRTAAPLVAPARAGAPQGQQSTAPQPTPDGLYLGDWAQGRYFRTQVRRVSEARRPLDSFLCEAVPSGSKYVVLDLVIQNTDTESRTLLDMGRLFADHQGQMLTYDISESCVLGQEGYLDWTVDLGPLVQREGRVAFLVPSLLAVDQMRYETPRDGDVVALRPRP